MAFIFSIPRMAGGALDVTVKPGEALFIVGPNGAGKSSLVQSLFAANKASARRISAHRQNWFDESGPTYSAGDREQTADQFRIWDSLFDARWREHAPEARPKIAIYDLQVKENSKARELAAAVRSNSESEVAKLTAEETPMGTLNQLFKQANIPIHLTIDDLGDMKASRNGSPPYPTSRMSDGERNAMLTASIVLTVAPGTLVLIDEPERHLHRSIGAPLLKLLFEKRPDCAFVISTHDVDLPTAVPGARTLLVRDCALSDSSPTAWDIDELPPSSDLDETLKRDILGARRILLFVEGEEHSLDKPLYSLLFPGATVVAKGSCRDVEHAVSGVRGAAKISWVQAYGIVDNDRRDPADIKALEAKGVYAPPSLSVESIYYDSEMVDRVAVRMAKAHGGDATKAKADAKARALAAIPPQKAHLVKRAVHQAVRSEFYKQLPGKEDIANGKTHTATVDIGKILKEEEKELDALHGASDLDGIVAGYGIRHTPAPDRIADALGLQGRSQYEQTVRAMLAEDPALIEAVRKKYFLDLAAALKS